MNKKKPMIEMLLHKWTMLCEFASIQKTCLSYNLEPDHPVCMYQQIYNIDKSMALENIQKIKDVITTLMPDTQYIETDYEEDFELNPEDFIELYISHQELCIKKIKDMLNTKPKSKT